MSQHKKCNRLKSLSFIEHEHKETTGNDVKFSNCYKYQLSMYSCIHVLIYNAHQRLHLAPYCLIFNLNTRTRSHKTGQQTHCIRTCNNFLSPNHTQDILRLLSLQFAKSDFGRCRSFLPAGELSGVFPVAKEIESRKVRGHNGRKNCLENRRRRETQNMVRR